MSDATTAPAPRDRGWRDALGHLRSPDSGILGQGARFAIAGGTVAVVYLTLTTLLSAVIGLPFQVALAFGYVMSVTLHFTLQRVFVWAHHEQFALPLGHQIARYLPTAATQYGVTAASTALLPGALGLPTEVVYLVTFAIVVSANFVIFRHGIFHAAEPSEGIDGSSPPPSLDGIPWTAVRDQ